MFLLSFLSCFFLMKSQVRVFYSVRLFLGLISAITETVLVIALSRKYGKRMAWYTLAMLCLTSGCFFASTSKFLVLFYDRMLYLFLVNMSNILMPICCLSSGFGLCKGCSQSVILYNWSVISVFSDLYCSVLFRFFAQYFFYVCCHSFLSTVPT